MSARPFTPTQERDEDLDRRTVGRDRQLAVLQERLRLAATTKSRQHTLVVGPRGSGKTHLLQVAIYRAVADPATAAGLAIAHVPEDAIGLTSYADLLRELADGLGIAVERERNPGTLEDVLLDAAGERTLVFVMENLDKVFESIGDAGQRDLRSWVETSGRILVLAATPALFSAVRDRRKPWFGGLIEMPLEGLSANEGRELLTYLAVDRGDQALADALQSDWGKARIQAVSQLTAGSPRIWTVFSDCLNVETLDELIPAVEGLVEGLVPYYQSLLWELSGNQQAVVRQLAEGKSAALTASEIAANTGLSQQTVSKVLNVLKASRWVRDMKLSDGDQRRTWYELREPMLRHHFQWRATGGETLRLIVDLLRAWYDPSQLRYSLSITALGTPREAYLIESLRATPPIYYWAIDTETPNALLVAAREWLRGDNPVYTAEVGLYTELCIMLTEEHDTAISDLIRMRTQQFSILNPPNTDIITSLVAHAKSGSDLAALLEIISTHTEPNISSALLLLAAKLTEHSSAQRSEELLDKAIINEDSAIGLAITLEHILRQQDAGDTPLPFQTVAKLLPKVINVRGPNDPMTLITRIILANLTEATRDFEGALALYQSLLPDLTKTLGPADRHALSARYHIANCFGQIWDLGRSLELYADLLADNIKLYGPDDHTTLNIRYQIAYYTGLTWNTPKALILYKDLLPDMMRVLGSGAKETLLTRGQIAILIGRSGDTSLALQLHQELLTEAAQVLDTSDIMGIRYQIAFLISEINGIGEGLSLYENLLQDAIQAFGPDDEKTRIIRAEVELCSLLAHDNENYTDLIDSARKGDQEAWIRLPPELRPLVEAR